MAWYDQIKSPKIKNKSTGSKATKVPDGMWDKCTNCGEILQTQTLLKNLKVCPSCGHHFRLSARDRIASLVDEGSFTEFQENLKTTNPLEFVDLKPYPDRLKKAENSTDLKDAIIFGTATMEDQPVVIASFEFRFMGGSMGSVVGEKITQAFELSLENKCPCLVISASGGARMQEGILSLMQMAKTVSVINRMKKNNIPYISVLTDPTTGGVAASFAMLGDINVSEPNALIGFAGPRVIQQTIRQQLPEGFQRAEFLLEHGFIDMIIPRSDMRETLTRLVKRFSRNLSSKISKPKAPMTKAKKAKSNKKTTSKKKTAKKKTAKKKSKKRSR